MVIEPEEAAKLIRAVAHNNTFARGRKNRMEAWKVVFGVYVSVRFKHPNYTIAGLRWKLHYDMYGGTRYTAARSPCSRKSARLSSNTAALTLATGVSRYFDPQ